MDRGLLVAFLLAFSLLNNVSCRPAEVVDLGGYDDNEIHSDLSTPVRHENLISPGSENKKASENEVEMNNEINNDDDVSDDDDFFNTPVNVSPENTGSNIFSLLNMASALFPASSGANSQNVANQPPPSALKEFKVEILKALLKFGARLLGQASTMSTGTNNNGQFN